MSDSTFPLRLKNSLKIFLPEKVLESAKSYFQFMFNKLGIFFYLEKAEKIEFLKTLRFNFLQQTQMKKVFNGEVLRLGKINGCYFERCHLCSTIQILLRPQRRERKRHSLTVVLAVPGSIRSAGRNSHLHQKHPL